MREIKLPLCAATTVAIAAVILSAVSPGFGAKIDQTERGYDLIKETGKFCPERDSCSFGRRSRGPNTLDWRNRNCFCDPDCALYGDCCIDAPAYSAREQKEQYNVFSCKNIEKYGNLYMRSECPKDFNNPNITAACNNNDSIKDPIGALPVTSMLTGITYSNYYCAVCNQDTTQMMFWEPGLKCPTLESYNSTFQNITGEFLQENMVQSPQSGEWGVDLEEDGVSVFHECFIENSIPSDVEDKIRRCNGANVTSECPPDFEDNRTTELCSSYTALIYSTSEETYRNPHCALCNNETVSNLICINLASFGRSGGSQLLYRFSPIPLAVLFDINGSGNQGSTVGVVDRCQRNIEIWDPFFKKCRNVVCGDPGKLFVDGHCYSPGQAPTTTPSSSTTSTTGAPSTSSTTAFIPEDSTSVADVVSNSSLTEEPSPTVLDLLSTTSMPPSSSSSQSLDAIGEEELGADSVKEEQETNDNSQAEDTENDEVSINGGDPHGVESEVDEQEKDNNVLEEDTATPSTEDDSKGAKADERLDFVVFPVEKPIVFPEDDDYEEYNDSGFEEYLESLSTAKTATSSSTAASVETTPSEPQFTAVSTSLSPPSTTSSSSAATGSTTSTVSPLSINSPSSSSSPSPQTVSTTTVLSSTTEWNFIPSTTGTTRRPTDTGLQLDNAVDRQHEMGDEEALVTCTKISLTPDEYDVVTMQEDAQDRSQAGAVNDPAGRNRWDPVDSPVVGIYIPVYNLSLTSGQYHMDKETGLLTICRPAIFLDYPVGLEKFSPVMGYVTFACLGVSMVCLVLHLLVTCVTPELQNLSGKNLFCLSLALLGAYTCFIANMLGTGMDRESCFVLAIIMYYFYLAAFFWMLNIAFNVARSLRLASTQLRLTTGAQWGKFIAHCVTGWILPGLLVVLAGVLDRVQGIPNLNPDFLPGFGNSQVGLCWFSSREALLVWFVVPFSFVMALNVVFFLSSACLVWESSQSTAKITTTGPKISFHLYLRLASLMGLSWILGVVAGGLDIEEIWYVFLVFNTLQGVFIFLFFTCSQKVMRSLKERVVTGSSVDENPTWQWSKNKQNDSQDSNLSTSSGFIGKQHRSSYEQYHRYDQRFYS